MNGQRRMRPPRLLPRRGLSGGLLVSVIAVMVFLAAVALAGGLALGSAIEGWRDAVARDLTVQVAAASEAEGEAAVGRVLDALTGMPGLARAHALSRAELEALLEPWLGAGNVPPDLPLPRLVDVELAPGARVDAAAVQARLDAAVPGARVEDPAQWLTGIIGIAGRARILAGGAVALVLAALAAIVVFATRAGLEANRELVDVLHQIGARDSYVAAAFQRHFLGLGLKGAAAGLALALVSLLALQGLGGGAAGGLAGMSFLAGLSLSAGQWAIIAALAPLVAGMTTLTARLTVRRTLAELV